MDINQAFARKWRDLERVIGAKVNRDREEEMMETGESIKVEALKILFEDVRKIKSSKAQTRRARKSLCVLGLTENEIECILGLYY